jgi:hypothetical protein
MVIEARLIERGVIIRPRVRALAAEDASFELCCRSWW